MQARRLSKTRRAWYEQRRLWEDHPDAGPFDTRFKCRVCRELWTALGKRAVANVKAGVDAGYAHMVEDRREWEPPKAATRRVDFTVVAMGDATINPCMRGYAPASHRNIEKELANRYGTMVARTPEFRSSKLCFRCGR